MKIYVIDENCQVIFEYSEKSKGFTKIISFDIQSKVISAVSTTLQFLLGTKV